MRSTLLLNLLRPNLNFTACVEADISTRELHSRRHLKEKVCDQTNDVVYRPHLSKDSQFKFPTDTMLYHAQIFQILSLEVWNFFNCTFYQSAKKFVQKLETIFQDITNIKTEFPLSGKIFPIELHMGCILPEMIGKF